MKIFAGYPNIWGRRRRRGIYMGLFDFFKHKQETKIEKDKELLELAREIGMYRDDSYDVPDQVEYYDGDFDLEVYEKMMNDGQVNAGIKMIQLAATSKGVVINARTEEEKVYADFIYKNLEHMQGSMEDKLEEMLTALVYGFSCTEKVFEYNDGALMLKKLKVLNPHTVRIRTNRFGDIEYVQQVMGSKTIKISPDKIMWYTYDSQFSNPYGKSALRPAYKYFYMKDAMYRFANIAYERYGTPLLVGQVEDAKDVGKMSGLLRKINGMTGLAISGGDDIKAINGSTADFIGYIEHLDRKTMESLLVPPMLLGLSRGQSGSYALSENMFDIFMLRLMALQRELRSLIQTNVIKPLIDLNFSNVQSYPQFQFRPLAEADKQKLATVFSTMITAGVIEPSEDWIREELGFEEADEDTKSRLKEGAKLKHEALVNGVKGAADGAKGGRPSGNEGSKGEDEKK